MGLKKQIQGLFITPDRGETVETEMYRLLLEQTTQIFAHSPFTQTGRIPRYPRPRLQTPCEVQTLHFPAANDTDTVALYILIANIYQRPELAAILQRKIYSDSLNRHQTTFTWMRERSTGLTVAVSNRTIDYSSGFSKITTEHLEVPQVIIANLKSMLHELSTLTLPKQETANQPNGKTTPLFKRRR